MSILVQEHDELKTTEAGKILESEEINLEVKALLTYIPPRLADIMGSECLNKFNYDQSKPLVWNGEFVNILYSIYRDGVDIKREELLLSFEQQARHEFTKRLEEVNELRRTRAGLYNNGFQGLNQRYYMDIVNPLDGELSGNNDDNLFWNVLREIGEELDIGTTPGYFS